MQVIQGNQDKEGKKVAEKKNPFPGSLRSSGIHCHKGAFLKAGQRKVNRKARNSGLCVVVVTTPTPPRSTPPRLSFRSLEAWPPLWALTSPDFFKSSGIWGCWRWRLGLQAAFVGSAWRAKWILLNPYEFFMFLKLFQFFFPDYYYFLPLFLWLLWACRSRG